MYKVSVVIPVYNVERFIKECMDSLIDQTIGFENIEVIMVDDCSTDSSFKIMKEYENKYKNCIAIQLEKNSGVAGKPRNVAIERATGKYLMFTDPDDFYSLDACEKMYNYMEEKGADFIISNWINADEDGTPWKKAIFDEEKYKPFKLSINDFEDSFYIMNSSMSNKIFNREFIIKNNIRCLEGVPFEDTYFSMSSFIAAENVYYVDDIIYFYRQRNSCSTDSLSISWNCSREYFRQMNIACKAIYEKFVESNHISFYRFLYARNLTYLLYRFIDSDLLSKEERIEIFSEMRWFYKLSETLKVPAVQKSLHTLITKIIHGNYNDAIDICNIIAEIRGYMPSDIKQKMSKPYAQMYKEMMTIKFEE